MLFKFIKKLTLYIFPTADDQKFYSLVKGSFFKSEEEPVLTTLVDCTHLGFKRWNIELLFTLSGISRVHNRNFIAFYPSYFFIWNTLQSKMVWLIKKIYNKDNHIFNLFFISEKIAPSYFKFLFSNYEFNEFNEFNEFLSKDEVLNFKYKGVKIGYLVYDSYLKENRKATVDIKSKELAFIIKKACF